MTLRRCLRGRGLSLVELLVALALSLGVLLAASVLFSGANHAYGAHADAVDVDDSGRFALALLGRAVRQGAFVNWEGPGAAAMDPAAPAPLAGFDNRTLPETGVAIAGALPGAVHGSDVLAVRYPGAGAAPHGDGSVLNCAGFAVHAAEEGWSIFYVARNAGGEAELRCKYRGTSSWSADALVKGVDSFQVLYGIDTDTPRDGIPNRYVNASTILALDAGLGLASAAELNRHTWWKRVASVRVALLLHGERPSPAAVQPGSYALFGPGYGTGPEPYPDPGTWLSTAALDGGARAPSRRLFSAVFAVGAPLE
ncbi:PilW family protein [Massilia niabensis]|uniref:PilW family protein n=1 Tax=Massilia niabensis TaxID=544910 RepID=A0ABW0L2P5_9BURK